jgi:hypothetical protein
MKLKNRAAMGATILKMDDATYALRRNVMGVIYEAKRHADLPRIEVRIVDTPPCLLGYAYLNQNIVHIASEVAKGSRMQLVGTVLHEILHATKGTKHDPRCPLMESSYREPSCEGVFWDAFTRYF